MIQEEEATPINEFEGFNNQNFESANLNQEI